ncbi:MAG: malto-oligosyltrehalose trehalohydrolase [Rhodospirillaceae bacterium]|nr:malto-oligosyltrehalose trehalohydrolase [Rhodospirillaceae bacterium]
MSGRFAHEMPFGAEIQSDGTVRFALWAPAQEAVSVVVDGDVVPMAAGQDGWFELVTRDAGAGSRYGFRLADGFKVPDPASRLQAEDVHGDSIVVDPGAYDWRTPGWTGRPWEEAVLYELHVGTFSSEGTFEGIRRRLDHFADLGVTAIELMPIADFPGARNWGYDGVLPYAPDTRYGTPEDLKRLIDDAHGRGLMVFLDVVYNHFGPEGNYLHLYAPQTFTDRHHTPWGAAIDFSRRPVRDYFIHNALYWLEEYRFDGLRFDAVHAILDDDSPHILTELAETVRARIGKGRHAHLVLENDANQARYLRPGHYDAQWNDDCHHAAHCVLTGESGGYYADYADSPIARLGRALAEGFIYQGEPSAFRDGEPRGEPSKGLPTTAFVDFIQNHDQVGNRAFGERLTMLAQEQAVAALQAVLLLAPSVPMLFMGEEWGAKEPFLFFCDFGDELAQAVRDGRRREFARFPEFRDASARAAIPDPIAPETFAASRLDWGRCDEAALARTRRLLDQRHAHVVPRLAGARGTGYRVVGARGLAVTWSMGDGAFLRLAASLGDETAAGDFAAAGKPIFESAPDVADGARAGAMPPWSVAWFLDPSTGAHA